MKNFFLNIYCLKNMSIPRELWLKIFEYLDDYEKDEFYNHFDREAYYTKYYTDDINNLNTNKFKFLYINSKINYDNINPLFTERIILDEDENDLTKFKKLKDLTIMNRDFIPKFNPILIRKIILDSNADNLDIDLSKCINLEYFYSDNDVNVIFSKFLRKLETNIEVDISFFENLEEFSLIYTPLSVRNYTNINNIKKLKCNVIDSTIFDFSNTKLIELSIEVWTGEYFIFPSSLKKLKFMKQFGSENKFNIDDLINLETLEYQGYLNLQVLKENGKLKNIKHKPINLMPIYPKSLETLEIDTSYLYDFDLGTAPINLRNLRKLKIKYPNNLGPLPKFLTHLDIDFSMHGPKKYDYFNFSYLMNLNVLKLRDLKSLELLEFILTHLNENVNVHMYFDGSNDESYFICEVEKYFIGEVKKLKHKNNIYFYNRYEE
jgi:hypothetical protein